ncbi:MAG TPA: ribonuclease HII [Anaerolineae bacterium]
MPHLEIETTVYRETGLNTIAGIDEAGRGALAGPVAAAAVILPPGAAYLADVLCEVDDSKQLTPATRERLFDLIMQNALAYGTSLVSATVVDEIGILPATKRAMAMAVAQLWPAPDYLLIDGPVRLATLPVPQQPVIRGDSLCLSIAAASILAKVTRDRYMIELDGRYPEYGFAQHKGYGTPQHLAALASHGPSPVHRRSFAPIRERLF